eukprot:scaffold4931_cov392-Prasinococcus_capsulatus_cf.AAC.4
MNGRFRSASRRRTCLRHVASGRECAAWRFETEMNDNIMGCPGARTANQHLVQHEQGSRTVLQSQNTMHARRRDQCHLAITSKRLLLIEEAWGSPGRTSS